MTTLFLASRKTNTRDICTLYIRTRTALKKKITQCDCIVFQYRESWRRVIWCSISICMHHASGRSGRQCFLEHNTSQKAKIVLWKCCLQNPHWASPLQAMNNLVTKWWVSGSRCLPFHLWVVYINQTYKIKAQEQRLCLSRLLYQNDLTPKLTRKDEPHSQLTEYTGIF